MYVYSPLLLPVIVGTFACVAYFKFFQQSIQAKLTNRKHTTKVTTSLITVYQYQEKTQCKISNSETCTKFIADAMRKAAALLARGHTENGLHVLVQAVTASTKPLQFLRCLSLTLSREDFDSLVKKLPFEVRVTHDGFFDSPGLS